MASWLMQLLAHEQSETQLNAQRAFENQVDATIDEVLTEQFPEDPNDYLPVRQTANVIRSALVRHREKEVLLAQELARISEELRQTRVVIETLSGARKMLESDPVLTNVKEIAA
jgi:hypothetical protein